jgi:hypothetical protein
MLLVPLPLSLQAARFSDYAREIAELQSEGQGGALPPPAVCGPIRRRSEGGNRIMAFEDLKAELALLINQMENQPEDRHELYLQIREKLNEMRAFGMPLPEDLVRFEEELEAEFKAEERAAKK